MLLPAPESVGAFAVGISEPLSQRSPAAVPSNAVTALDPPWPCTVTVPIVSLPTDSGAGNNVVVYALPSVIDDVAASVSYASDGNNHEGSLAYGLTYTGVDGLSVSFGYGENNGTVNVRNEQLVGKASYAVGPITAGYSVNQVEKDAADSLTVSSMSLSYSVTDSLSVSYGEETFDRSNKTQDIGVSGVSGSYTSGGMTLGLLKYESENNDHAVSSTTNEQSYWQASLSFAF